MADRSIPIAIPVAIPNRFLGAPRMLSATLQCSLMVVAFISFIFRDGAFFGILCIVLALPMQVVAIYIGNKEPHADSLMRTYSKMKETTSIIGNRRSKLYPAG